MFRLHSGFHSIPKPTRQLKSDEKLVAHQKQAYTHSQSIHNYLGESIVLYVLCNEALSVRIMPVDATTAATLVDFY